MSRFDNAFLVLVKRVNEDALKVLDDALTYILSYFSIDERMNINWPYGPEQNKAFSEFMYTYLDFLNEQLDRNFWYDAWGDMFMENSGNFKSFRGQFFTPAAVSDLCAKISFSEDTTLPSGRPVVNDCACGSARMLLAANKQAFDKGSIQPYLVGEDIDGICCKMAAVNLVVHGCFGEVIRHDSLKEPGDFRYGYVINESLAAGENCPSLRISSNREDFWKLRNTIMPVDSTPSYTQLTLF
ncbi:MAG: N-6 DNA methylase [bacterium]